MGESTRLDGERYRHIRLGSAQGNKAVALDFLRQSFLVFRCCKSYPKPGNDGDATSNTFPQ